MIVLSAKKNQSQNRLILLFLIGWAIINFVQSYFTELHPDEAYYWIYSRFLDWGYFDHPPMVALFIRAGDTLFHNEFSLRLLTVLSSTFSLWILWQIIKPYQVEAKWFAAIISSIAIFHIFGFTTTPDAPLFFFSVLFYFFYQQYLKEDKISTAILLSIALAGAFYSKYHAILLVVFTLIANPKLFSRKSFWLVTVLTLMLFLPHIYWQFKHDFPSVKYHLYEREADHYQFQFTYLFIVGQFFMAGPLVSWFWYGSIARYRPTDVFTRTLLFNFIGTIIFFLINTSKLAVQPHWTLIGFLPMVMLALIALKDQPKPRFLRILLAINLLLLILMRLGLMIKNPLSMHIGVAKSYFGNPEWTAAIKQNAGNNYVIFQDNFQDPSWYNYYTNSLKGFSYDSRFYRRTQFDLWPIEDSLQQKRVYFVTGERVKEVSSNKIITPKDIFYGGFLDQTRTYQKITISAEPKSVVAKATDSILFRLKITNPYSRSISFSNQNQAHIVVLRAFFMQDNRMVLTQLAPAAINTLNFKAGEIKDFDFKLKMPAEKGNYALLFSVKTVPFSGPRSSPLIKINIQ